MGLIGVVFALNLADALLTVAWVSVGFATEANPVMEAYLSKSPVLFVAMKLSIVGLGSFLLWTYRRRPLAVIGVFVLFMVYYALLIYHLQVFADVLMTF